MDPVTLILAALVAGATTGASGAAATAVQDVYEAVKRRVAGHLGRDEAGRAALTRHESEPEAVRTDLERALTASGAAADDELIVLARQLLVLAEAGAGAGRRVDLTGAQGVQVGDGNHQVNHFSAPPR